MLINKVYSFVYIYYNIVVHVHCTYRCMKLKTHKLYSVGRVNLLYTGISVYIYYIDIKQSSSAQYIQCTYII